MKFINIIILLIFTNVLISQEFKVHSENEYSIQYPENWELNESKAMGTNFILFSPLNSKKDQFKENVNLIIQDLNSEKNKPKRIHQHFR